MALTTDIGPITFSAGTKSVTLSTTIFVRDEKGNAVASKDAQLRVSTEKPMQDKAKAYFVNLARTMLASANADRDAAEQFAELRGAIQAELKGTV